MEVCSAYKVVGRHRKKNRINMNDTIKIANEVLKIVTKKNEDSIDIFVNILKTLEIIKWPIVVIIVILVVKKPIIELINKIKKIGHGGTSLEIGAQNIIEKQEKNKVSNVDRILGLFREETIEFFKEAVNNETDIENYKTEKEKIEHLKNYSIALYIIKHYEMIYNSIYGSQLLLLQQLNTSVNQNTEFVKKYYDFAKEDYPKFYKDYSYENYLSFLYSYNLIVDEGRFLKITILGLDFLKYLTENSKDFDKMR